jgi:hypothetical protein
VTERTPSITGHAEGQLHRLKTPELMDLAAGHERIDRLGTAQVGDPGRRRVGVDHALSLPLLRSQRWPSRARRFAIAGVAVQQVAESEESVQAGRASVASWCLGRRSLGLWVCLPGAGQGPPQLSA